MGKWMVALVAGLALVCSNAASSKSLAGVSSRDDFDPAPPWPDTFYESDQESPCDPNREAVIAEWHNEYPGKEEGAKETPDHNENNCIVTESGSESWPGWFHEWCGC